MVSQNDQIQLVWPLKGQNTQIDFIQWKTNSKSIYVGSHYVIKKKKTFKQL